MTALESRLIRYADLRPCRNAFIDTRSPGSESKENFTLIGPGVSENPEQHVHIPKPHGFNIGGARQPSGCLNSQHSHDTAEVFVVHSGRWRFLLGPSREDGALELGPGDTISLPIHMFRGFEKLGEKDEIGFLFAVLGGDNPGKVTWNPSVFDLAKKYGLVLLEGGKLIDTVKGEKIPEGARLQQPPSAEELAQLKTPPLAEMEAHVRHVGDLLGFAGSPLAGPGVEECPIITPTATLDGFPPGPIVGNWPHGFCLRALKIASGARTPEHIRDEPEVLFVQEGALEVVVNGETLILGPGDTFTTPGGATRAFRASSSQNALVFVVRGGDRAGAVRFPSAKAA